MSGELNRVQSIASQFNRQASVAGGNATDGAKHPDKSSADLEPDERGETSSPFEVEIVRGNQPGPDGQTGVGIHYARPLAADGSALKTAPFVITGFVTGGPSEQLHKDRPDLLKVGQRLHAVDDTPVAGLSSEQVRSLVLGKPGSSVRVSVSQPDDKHVQTVGAAMKSMKGLGSAANILQLYKNADVNQFILMSRESSLSHSAGSPPQRPTGTAEQSITETTNNNTATPEDQQPYWRVTSQLGFLAPPPPMSPDVSKTEDKAEVVEHDQIKRSRGSLEKMSILMCSFKSKVDGPIQKEDSANVPSSALSESCNLPPFRAPPAPPLRSALANDEILEQDEDLPMALLDTGDVDSSKQQELQAGHQVVVLRDTHTHEGKAHHAGEVMVFEKEGTHGWTYVRDGKGVFCWLPSNALKAAGSGEADGGGSQTAMKHDSVSNGFPLAPSSNTGNVKDGWDPKQESKLMIAPSSDAGNGKDGAEANHESELSTSSDSGLSTALIPAVTLWSRQHGCTVCTNPKTAVAHILAIFELPEGIRGAHIELRLGKASSRSLALATGSSLIHINQSLRVDVPAQQGSKARIKLAVVDSLSERDIGYIVFPLDKVASSHHPVQGWYKLTEDGKIPDGDCTTDFCIQCQVLVEDQKSYQTTNSVPAGPVYRPSRPTASTGNDHDQALQASAFGSSGQADVYGIGAGLAQRSGIWFVDYLVPGGPAARSCCVQAFDRLCIVESAMADSPFERGVLRQFQTPRLMVGYDTTAEEVSNAVAGPENSFVKLTFARDQIKFSVILMRERSQEQAENISSSPPKGVGKGKGKGQTPSSSEDVSIGCMSFMKSKPKQVTRAPKDLRQTSEQHELQAGHQVVVLRDTHTHEGKAHHAGEVMVFEKEGTHGWTYVRDGKGVFCWLPSNALKAAGSGEADGRLMRTVLVPSSDDKTFRHSSSPISAPSSTGKRRSRGQFSPIRKHHVSPAIPPALTPLPRGQHVLWDDEAVEVDHDEPAHRPDHLLSAYHSQIIPWILGEIPESTSERKTRIEDTPIAYPLTLHSDHALSLSCLTTTLLAPRSFPHDSHETPYTTPLMTTPVLEPNGLQHFPHEHKDGQHSEAVFKELIHDFSSQRHSNAMRYLKMDKTATLQVPHPRLSLIPHQLLSETREVSQNPPFNATCISRTCVAICECMCFASLRISKASLPRAIYRSALSKFN